MDSSSYLEQDNIRQRFDNILDKFHTPGISIAICDEGKISGNGFGAADYETATPMTCRTLLGVGSMAKSTTAAVFGCLIEAGVRAPNTGRPLTWDTTLAEILGDDFSLQCPDSGAGISFEDALCHRTGMARHDLVWINNEMSFIEQVRAMRHLPLLHERGTRHEYCNLMYTAVACAICRIEDVPETSAGFKKVAQEWILRPLGMDETFLEHADASEYVKTSRFNARSEGRHLSLAQGYRWHPARGRHMPIDPDVQPQSIGKGGLISSVTDWAKWMRCLLRSFNPKSDLDISRQHPLAIDPAVFKKMTTPNISLTSNILPCFAGTDAYGLGLYISTYRNTLIWHHAGATNGFMSLMVMLPEYDWGVVGMQNDYSLPVNVVVWGIVDDFLDGKRNKKEKFDALGWAEEKEMEANAKGDERREKVRKLKPLQNNQAKGQGPALDLQAYEGVFESPAYGRLRVSTESDPRQPHPKLPNSSCSADCQTTPHLYMFSASDTPWMHLQLVLHHIRDEQWLAQMLTGPVCWMVDSFHYLEFSVSGNENMRVDKGLWYQAEVAIEGREGMSWFEKVD